MIYHYSLGLSQVERRLVEQKERELKYYEKIRILEFHNESKENCIKILKKELELIKKEKEGVDGKLEGFLTALKVLDNLIDSQRSDKKKEGLGYSAVPLLIAQIYSSSKKDLSWTGLPEFANDTIIDYSRPSPAIESTSDGAQNKNPSVTKTGASDSTTLSKPFIKFMKAADCTEVKTNKVEAIKKSSVKYVEMYRRTTKKHNVRGNQKNWNNLKTRQLGPDFVMKKKACFNCGDFNHLAYDCRKRVKKGSSRSQNKIHESFKPRPVVHRPFRPLVRPMRSNMNSAQPNRTTFNKQAHSYANRPFQRISAVRSQYRAPWAPTVNRNFPPVNRKFSTGSINFPTVNEKFPTVSRKFPTGSINVSTVCCCCSRHVNTARTKAVINRRNWVNDVKASACWVWKHVKSNSASIILKDMTMLM
uniref:Ubiquitin hydrolase n=1 Tax=Tanacetum cinerariifolium TaxID=118510 RepID=A0A6L2NYK4_TANCI|nr:ubiquitin hydrolase [Tanacetum cinerariifolium]